MYITVPGTTDKKCLNIHLPHEQDFTIHYTKFLPSTTILKNTYILSHAPYRKHYIKYIKLLG